jgi:spore germination protein GerM
MDIKKYLILGALLVLLAILIIVFFKSSGKEKIKPVTITPPPEIFGPDEEVRERKAVTLFYLSEEDSLLHSEEREIFVSASVVQEGKQVLEELIKGSRNGLLSPFPPQTQLRSFAISSVGIAYVDFSREFQDGHPSGSTAEISTVYSIVNSLTYNFRSIKRVFILIEGRERESLGGHINLSKPFLPLYDLIAK